MPTNSTVSEPVPLRGLEVVEQRIKKLAHPESGVHAVLIYGPSGSGKTVLARRLAQAWLCPNNAEGEACGNCPVCASFAAGRSVDFQEIKPYGAGRMIRLGAIHEVKPPDKEFEGVPIIDYFRTRPLMASHKAVHLQSAHRMNNDASNALLKTLEEPPPYAKLILETSDFSLLRTTIRSRCVAVACCLPEIDEQAAEEWQRVFARSIGDLERMQAAPDIFAKLYETLEPLANRPLSDALRAAGEIKDLGDQLAKKTGSSARDANIEILACVAEWAVLRMPHRPQAAQAAAEAVRRIQGNASASLVFDGLLISMLS